MSSYVVSVILAEDLPPPPSYQSLFGKVKRLQSESIEKVTCGDKAYSACCTACKSFKVVGGLQILLVFFLEVLFLVFCLAFQAYCGFVVFE